MNEEQAAELYSNLPNHLRDFIKLVESYYVPYASNIVRCFIALDLKDFTEDQLRELFDIIRREYSNTYKTPPDTNRLMKAWEKKFEQSGLKRVDTHYEDRHGNVFDSKMQKIGHYDGPRFIPNLSNPKMMKKVLKLGSAAITPERYLDLRTDAEVDTKEVVVRKSEK